MSETGYVCLIACSLCISGCRCLVYSKGIG